MPNWQKGRDYKDSFRAKLNMGGGVDIDLIHEIDYMVDLFGFPKKVTRLAGHYSNLVMDSCDLAVYLFEYDNMIAEVHLDYFGISDKRDLEIYSNDEVLTIDFIKKKAELKSTNEVISFNSEYNHYFEEIKYFIEFISGNLPNKNPIDHAYKVLKLAKGVI